MEKVKNLIINLDSWFEKQNFKGWDPYDIKGCNQSLKIQQLGNKNLSGKILVYSKA
jgi:hypothetical protein